MAKRKRKRKPHLRGKVEIVDLTKLQPNGWNGNVMDDLERESVKAGFRKEGWLVSQALTVWRTDESGEERLIIIDGEQRWTCALDVGLTTGPVVYLDGITEEEARALTVKLYTRRGSWTDEALATALQPLDLDVTDALDLGFEEPQFAELLSLEPEEVAAGGNEEREGQQRDGKKDGEAPYIFAILVECDSEADQQAKLDDCLKRGWSCRALI